MNDILRVLLSLSTDQNDGVQLNANSKTCYIHVKYYTIQCQE